MTEREGDKISWNSSIKECPGRVWGIPVYLTNKTSYQIVSEYFYLSLTFKNSMMRPIMKYSKYMAQYKDIKYQKQTI